ncbi:MAG: hypothetical protein M3O15_03210 [Acidobacteriota bacterium]|nr:hypothetical protein [Acidobacteriota bacterium]
MEAHRQPLVEDSVSRALARFRFPPLLLARFPDRPDLLPQLRGNGRWPYATPGTAPRGRLDGAGEIYLDDFPAAGPHPVIVVWREELNRGPLRTGRRLHFGALCGPRPAGEPSAIPRRPVWLYGRLHRAVRIRDAHYEGSRIYPPKRRSRSSGKGPRTAH